MGTSSKSFLLSCCLIFCFTRGTALDVSGAAAIGVKGSIDSSQAVFVSPNVVNMVSDDQQPMQLLDAAGLVLTDVEWSVIDSSVAEVSPGEAGEPALLRAKSPGQTKIIATAGGRSASCEVTVFSKGTRPDGILRWAAPALPGARGELSKIVQSVRIDDTTPDLYVGDGVRIRAFDQDGQQKWVWPVSGGTQPVRLLAGDDRGGAVAIATDEHGESIICIDSKGHQAWSYALEPGFHLFDYAIDRTGLVYVLVDQEQNPSQVLALEADSGRLRFMILAPTSVRASKNWENRNVQGHLVPVCTFGNEATSEGREKALSVTSEHGKLFVSSENSLYLPVLTQKVIFEASPCKSNSNKLEALDIKTSTLTYSATLQAMQIRDDGTQAFILLDSASYAGPNWTTPVRQFSPKERAIPDGNDDEELLLPSISAMVGLYGVGPEVDRQPEGRIYRFNRRSSTHYMIPLLPSAPADGDALLIGEQSNAFIMGTLNNRPVVASFDFNSGRGKWLSPAPYVEGALVIDEVMADDSLVLEYMHGSSCRLMMADPKGNIRPLFPYELAPLTVSNGPSFWTLSTWFVFLHDQSVARVTRMPS
jgi:Bacterial Ig-like domain (group 2)